MPDLYELYITVYRSFQMYRHKYSLIFFIILNNINVGHVTAQEIKGDTIFVNREADVQVKFPTLPTYYNTTPVDAPYSLKTLGKGFTVTARKEGVSAAGLSVVEGGRNHNFVLSFKKNINYSIQSELIYDYSTLEKIKGRIQELSNFKPAKAPEVTTAIPLPSNAVQTNTAAVVIKNDANDTKAKADLNKFINLVAQANVDLDLKKYKEALEGYKMALTLRPDEFYQQQVKKVEKLLYDEYIANGDKALTQNQLEAAREAFEQALTLKKNDPIAILRLKKVEGKEIAINTDLKKKQKEKEDKYLAKIKKANSEFENNHYPQAKQLYIEAGELMPLDERSNERLVIIQNTQATIDSLKAAVGTNKKYDSAVFKARSYYARKDFEKAREAWVEAAGIKPNELEPQEQLNIINTKLLEKASYQAKKAGADSALSAKNYPLALQLFNDALVIKPSDAYSMQKIKNTQQLITNQTILETRSLIDSANKAVTAENWNVAEQLYVKALEVQPDNAYAISRLKIVRDHIIIKNTEVTTVDLTGTRNKMQKTSIPYTAEELQVKYPNIDFKSPPPEQPLNEADDAKISPIVLNKVLSNEPRFDISAKKNRVKLTFLDNYSEGGYAYVKLLIQNNADKDFLTGPMMLTWTKKTGINIRLFPVHFFPAEFPIVQPGNESVVIYVIKYYYIENEEKLKFELNDRMNKIKLELNFSGLAWNHKAKR